MGTLRRIVGATEPSEVVLDAKRTVLGAHASAHVRLLEPGMPDYAAAIVRTAHGPLLVDEGTGLLRVQGEPVDNHFLRDGDEIEIGGARWHVSLTESSRTTQGYVFRPPSRTPTSVPLASTTLVAPARSGDTLVREPAVPSSTATVPGALDPAPTEASEPAEESMEAFASAPTLTADPSDAGASASAPTLAAEAPPPQPAPRARDHELGRPRPGSSRSVYELGTPPAGMDDHSGPDVPPARAPDRRLGHDTPAAASDAYVLGPEFAPSSRSAYELGPPAAPSSRSAYELGPTLAPSSRSAYELGPESPAHRQRGEAAPPIPPPPEAGYALGSALPTGSSISVYELGGGTEETRASRSVYEMGTPRSSLSTYEMGDAARGPASLEPVVEARAPSMRLLESETSAADRQQYHDRDNVPARTSGSWTWVESDPRRAGTPRARGRALRIFGLTLMIIGVAVTATAWALGVRPADVMSRWS